MTSSPDNERRSLSYDDSRDRLIRLEEGVKHINQTLQEIRIALDLSNTAHANDYKETNKRVDALEKRVDKIYWVWGAVVFFGSPVMFFVTKFAAHQLGL